MLDLNEIYRLVGLDYSAKNLKIYLRKITRPKHILVVEDKMLSTEDSKNDAT